MPLPAFAHQCLCSHYESCPALQNAEQPFCRGGPEKAGCAAGGRDQDERTDCALPGDQRRGGALPQHQAADGVHSLYGKSLGGACGPDPVQGRAVSPGAFYPGGRCGSGGQDRGFPESVHGKARHSFCPRQRRVVCAGRQGHAGGGALRRLSSAGERRGHAATSAGRV